MLVKGGKEKTTSAGSARKKRGRLKKHVPTHTTEGKGEKQERRGTMDGKKKVCDRLMTLGTRKNKSRHHFLLWKEKGKKNCAEGNDMTRTKRTM